MNKKILDGELYKRQDYVCPALNIVLLNGDCMLVSGGEHEDIIWIDDVWGGQN